jgi:hypothetical protein
MEKKYNAQDSEDIIIINLLNNYFKKEWYYSVEFGGWDGVYLSNIASLNDISELIFIEGNKSRCFQGIKNYKGQENVHFVNQFVSLKYPNRIDDILEKLDAPEEIDVLSIDIDGNDYHILNSINKYFPNILVIEYNYSIPNHIEFIQNINWKINQGSSALSISLLAEKMGYKLVHVTKTNLIFMKQFSLESFSNKKILSDLRNDNDTNIYLFYGYDGTIFLSKDLQINWQKLNFKKDELQYLPSFLRKYPPARSGVNYWMRFIYLRIIHFLNRVLTKC